MVQGIHMTKNTDAEKSEEQQDQAALSPSLEGDKSCLSQKPRKQFDIDIFRDWCKSCGICAAFCPRGCIELDADGSPFVKDADRCTGCGWCEIHCPDFAISVRVRKNRKVLEQEED
jgi:2-oxoglutarate ferredoxin oxidoreductase subunit delta